MPPLPPAIAALSKGLSWEETWRYYKRLDPSSTQDDGVAAIRAGICAILISREVAFLVDALSCMRRLQRLGQQAEEGADLLLTSAKEITAADGVVVVSDDPLSHRMRALASCVASGTSARTAEIRARAEVERRLNRVLERSREVTDFSGLKFADQMRRLAEMALSEGDLALAADLFTRAAPKELSTAGGLARQARASAEFTAELLSGTVPERL